MPSRGRFQTRLPCLSIADGRGRPDYIQAFFEVINWERVNENFRQARA
jgi:hypothetical protein